MPDDAAATDDATLRAAGDTQAGRTDATALAVGGATTRYVFLNLAGKFNLLLLTGILLFWLLLGARPWDLIHWSLADVGIGLLAAFPLLLAVYVSSDLNRLVLGSFGPVLAACRWYDLVLLAVMAGALEELFAHGIVQPTLRDWGFPPVTAIVLANALFAIGYAATRAYFVAAFLAGCYLSGIMTTGTEDNLLRSIVAHSVFLIIALNLLAILHRRSRPTSDTPADAAPAVAAS